MHINSHRYTNNHTQKCTRTNKKNLVHQKKSRHTKKEVHKTHTQLLSTFHPHFHIFSYYAFEDPWSLCGSTVKRVADSNLVKRLLKRSKHLNGKSFKPTAAESALYYLVMVVVWKVLIVGTNNDGSSNRPSCCLPSLGASWVLAVDCRRSFGDLESHTKNHVRFVEYSMPVISIHA